MCTMSGVTFEQLRLPIALVLVIVAAFVFLPRDGGTAPVASAATPSPSIVVGEPGGEVIPSDTPPAVPTPVATASTAPSATPEPTEEETPEAVAQGGFQVVACTSISGDSCNGELGTLPANAGAFTALVRFTDANAGDTLNAVLEGPSGTIPGAAYTLQGGGAGYYYSTFQAGGLPAGEYTLVATRNGSEVASTTFTRGG